MCNDPSTAAHLRVLSDPQALAFMLPGFLQQLVNKTAQVAGDFVPFGTFCLMLADAVRIIDSTAQPQLLQITVSQLFKSVQRVGGDEESAPLVIQRFLVDHRVQSYKNVLRTAIQSMVPLLFMGGKISDYQPMLVQRQTPNGR